MIREIQNFDHGAQSTLNIPLISVRVIVLNATFNNISVLLVEEIGVHGENHWTAASNVMLYRVHLAWAGFELTTSVVIGTDCIGSWQLNYYTQWFGGLTIISWLPDTDNSWNIVESDV